MKLSCAFVLALTNLVIASPFSLSVKGRGTSAKAGATAVPETFGLVHHVPSTAGGHSGSSSSSHSVGVTSSSLNSGALFNYNSGHVYDSSEYTSPGEVSHNIASIPKVAIAAEETHTNVKNFENTEASESFSPQKTNDYSTNSVSYLQYQPSSLESKPSSLFDVGHLTSGGSHENSEHNVFVTHSQQPPEQQSLPCQTFNNVSPFPTLSNANKVNLIADKSPLYNGGFGGPSGILNPNYKATGSNSFSAQQSTIETVKPLPQSLSNGYKNPSSERSTNVKPLNEEKTYKEQFVTSSPNGQLDYIKDKNTPLYIGAHLPSTSEHTGENLAAPTFNVSKPIQNLQIFVQPHYDNVNVQDKKTYATSENTEKIKQTPQSTYTGGFGAPTGILKPFRQPQTGSHTFVSSGKFELYETKTDDVTTTTNTQESATITTSESPLNEVKVTSLPSTERINYQYYESDSPAISYANQKPSSPVYDEHYSVSSDSPVLSTSGKSSSNHVQQEHKEIDHNLKQSENSAFNPTVSSENRKVWSTEKPSSIDYSFSTQKPNNFANPSTTVTSQVNSYHVPSQQFVPNFPVSSTDVGTTSVEPTLVTLTQQSSNAPSIGSSLTYSSVPKVSENPKVWSTQKPSSIDYSFSTQKPNNFANPSTTVTSQVNSYHVPSQQFVPNLPVSSTNVGTTSVEPTLVTLAQQPSYAPSIGSSLTDSSVPKVSENPKVWSTQKPSSIDYSFSTQKPNNFANPSTTVTSQVNSYHVPSQQSVPNLPVSSTNVGTTSVEPTLVTLSQQSSYAPSIGSSLTDSSVPKVSENPKVWSTQKPSSIDYSFSTQKPNNFANPSTTVTSQVNSYHVPSQQFVPNLPVSSTNVGTTSVEPTLVTLAQQPSYAPSIGSSLTDSSVPKVSENPKVWSTQKPSSIDYSFSTQKPNNFANPSTTVTSQVNSYHVPSQQFVPNLPVSSTNVGTTSVEPTLVTLSQQSSYAPSIGSSLTDSSVPKVSENPKVWSTQKPSSIDYSFLTQKPNNFANPSTTVTSQVNSYHVPSQQFVPNLPVSSTNVGTTSVEPTLVTLAQQPSYAPSIGSSLTDSSVPKVSENPKVWSTQKPSSIDYSFSTQKPNNFANPSTTVTSQVNSYHVPSQQFVPNFPVSSTDVGTTSVEPTLVTLTQQSSNAPSIGSSLTDSSVPKVSENPKVWSTQKPSSIDYSFSTQKPNNFANPSTTVTSQVNSYHVPSQQSVPNLPVSSTNVGTTSVEPTLVTLTQQSSNAPSIGSSLTDSSVPKVSENPKVWSTQKPSSIDYSFSTQKPNNFANPSTTVTSQVNSYHVPSQQSVPNLPVSSTNVGTTSVEPTLLTLAQQPSYAPSIGSSLTDSSVPKVSENPKVWSTQKPSSIDYSFSTQKPNNFANPSTTVTSQVNSYHVPSQQSVPNLPVSSTNVGTTSVEPTLVTLSQQSSYAPSIGSSLTDSSVPKVSENPKVWSTQKPSSIDYSFSTQKPNNFANPSTTVTSQVNSYHVPSQQFVPNLPVSSTNVGTTSVEPTLVTLAQQPSYAPSIGSSLTDSSVPKVSENPKVWSTQKPSSIDYSFSTQKPNNFANPSTTVTSQVNSYHVPSQQFVPNLPVSSTNVGTTSVEPTLVTLSQQSSYAPSIGSSLTDSSVPKVSENPKVWSTQKPSSIDYSFLTQKPNNFANPSTTVTSQVNSYHVPSQQFVPNLPVSSTNVGTTSVEPTLVTLAQQPSYAPSIGSSLTDSSVPKVSENPKVWSTQKPSSIDYSFSTQKPNNFANPSTTVTSQVNSYHVPSQQFVPNFPVSSTDVGTTSVEPTLVTLTQQSSNAPSIGSSLTDSSVPKVSENPKVWSTQKPSSIDYSFSTQKPNNFANPSTTVTSQVNSYHVPSQQSVPNLPVSSTNVGTTSVEPTLVTLTQQSSNAPSIGSSLTDSSVPKVSENPKVWSTQKPSSIDYSFSTQKPNNFANPSTTVTSQVNSYHVPSQQSVPNLPVSSTNVGTTSVEPTLLTLAQQPSYAPSIGSSLTGSSVPKVSENSEVNPETFSSVSHFNSDSHTQDSQSESSPALTISNGVSKKPLYSNTLGTLSGVVKPTDYSHLNSLPSSTSNSKYNPGLITVSSDKLEQHDYFNQHKPALGNFGEKTTILNSSYTTDSIYVSTAKPHAALAFVNTVQKNTDLNEKSSKTSSSLNSDTIYPKLTQRPEQLLNHSGVSSGSLVTSTPVQPPDSKVSISSVLPTNGPVFGYGLSQSTPQYQYSTVHPANQNKQWYTNTFETHGGVKPQNSYTYPGFTSSFTSFGYGSSIVANKQFNKLPSTGQYKPYSIGQYNPTSAGQYVPSSIGYYNPISTGQYKPSSSGRYNPISTGQHKPTSTGQYNPTLTGQYTPYNWGFFKQPVTLKPFGLPIPAKDPIVPASTPTTDKPLEKLKPYNSYSVLNKKEPGFTSVFASPTVFQTTLKPIPSAEITNAPVTEGPSTHTIEDYSEDQKITTLVSTTPKSITQKPWFIGTQAATDKTNNLSGNSVTVTSPFTSSVKPTVTPSPVVPSNNLPSNILSSGINLKETSYINNFGVVSSNSKTTGQLSPDHRDISISEKTLSTTPKSISPIKQTTSISYVAQTASSLLAGSVNTKNSQLTTSNYENQQTLNQNSIQLDTNLSISKPSQETYEPETVHSSEGTSSNGYDTSSPEPTNVPLLQAPEHITSSGDSIVVLKPPKGLLENTVQNQSSTFNNINIFVPASESNDKVEVKDQVTSNNSFQHNLTVFNNSFKPLNSAFTSNPGLTFASKPGVQSLDSQKDSMLAQNQANIDGNVKPISQLTTTSLHYSTSTQIPSSIINSSNQQKDTATVFSSAQLHNAETVYQKPVSQHSLANTGSSQFSKPNIKVTVINQPSGSTVDSQYLGRFGGPSGILKPHEFSGPSIHANAQFQNNLSHFNQPTSTVNTGVKVAENTKSVSYSAGFGGPSGVLTPDNSEKQTGISYAGQDKQWSHVQTSGFHGSLTSHNLSPGAPFVGTYVNNKKQNAYGLHAATANSQVLSSSNVNNHNNQQHPSGTSYSSGNSKSSSSLSGQFGKVNGLTTSGSVAASTGAEKGLSGSTRPFISASAAAHGSSGLLANTGYGRKIF